MGKKSKKELKKEEFAKLVMSGKSYSELESEYGMTKDAVRQKVLRLKKNGYIPESFDARKRNGKKQTKRRKITQQKRKFQKIKDLKK